MITCIERKNKQTNTRVKMHVKDYHLYDIVVFILLLLHFGEYENLDGEYYLPAFTFLSNNIDSRYIMCEIKCGRFFF